MFCANLQSPVWGPHGLTVFCETKRNEERCTEMNISNIITVRFLRTITENKEQNSESAEYADSKICILRNELFEDCNDMQQEKMVSCMQPISSDSLTLLVFTTRCSDDF